MQLIAILIAAVPFAFGGLRLATTGDDARYLWVACCSVVGLTMLARAWQRRAEQQRCRSSPSHDGGQA